MPQLTQMGLDIDQYCSNFYWLVHNNALMFMSGIPLRAMLPPAPSLKRLRLRWCAMDYFAISSSM